MTRGMEGDEKNWSHPSVALQLVFTSSGLCPEPPRSPFMPPLTHCFAVLLLLSPLREGELGPETRGEL